MYSWWSCRYSPAKNLAFLWKDEFARKQWLLHSHHVASSTPFTGDQTGRIFEQILLIDFTKILFLNGFVTLLRYSTWSSCSCCSWSSSASRALVSPSIQSNRKSLPRRWRHYFHQTHYLDIFFIVSYSVDNTEIICSSNLFIRDGTEWIPTWGQKFKELSRAADSTQHPMLPIKPNRPVTTSQLVSLLMYFFSYLHDVLRSNL